MNRNNYDDWNFMGKSLTGTVSDEKGFTYNFKRNSVVLFTVVLILIVFGLVCTYSATYPKALEEGRNHYYYLQNQIIFILAGSAVGLLFYFIPEKTFEVISPVSVFVIFGLSLVLSFGEKYSPSLSYSLIMLGISMYLSHYFGKRNNRFYRLREIALPLLFCVAFFVLVSLQNNVMMSFLYFVLIIYLFALGGVGLGGVLLLVLFIAVPFVCSFLSNADEIREVLNFFIPGIYKGADATQSVLRYKSISSGSLMGKGVALGVYKYGIIDGISGPYILCSIFEEFGFFGFGVISFLFVLIIILGYSGGRALRDKNCIYSNLCNSMTTLIVWKFLLNTAAVFEVLPFSFLSMPFFSYGPDIAVLIIECSILLKTFKKEKEKAELPVYQKYDYSQEPALYEE
ncbi:MAG: FtsW/RodA/SpoVE family cell cycle protein [Sphaerochaetaceae bacterium]|nr:FtsW/RodA/SpoVE family cell cycle protein [Sphaerochaetaceae bacterium]